MATVLITGANQGIGLALARTYAVRDDTIFATARDPAKADALRLLAPNVLCMPLDITSNVFCTSSVKTRLSKMWLSWSGVA